MQILLDETFTRESIDPRLRWWNPPPRWGIDRAAHVLWVEPAGKTDFWRKTHYGFEADNGHVLAMEVPVERAWTMSTHVRFEPKHQYDQAGLIARVSPMCWLKTSVEYEPDGAARLGAVVTNGGWSDWSTQDWPSERREVWLRVSRSIGGDYAVEASSDGMAWSQIRMAHLIEDEPSQWVAGLYACSPKAAGFRAEFTMLRLVTQSSPSGSP